MYDVECPYCGEEQDINHDDGYGYKEDEKHQQTCPACRKEFVFETRISFHYETHMADCLNGAPHNMVKVISSANDIWPDWKRCKDCDHEERGEYKAPLEEK